MIKRLAAGGLATLLALGLTAGPASATTLPQPVGHRTVSPMLTDPTLEYDTTWYYSFAGNTYSVAIYWGFDYSPTSHNIRAVAEMYGNSTSIHVQANPIRLGTPGAVLAQNTVDSQTGTLVTETTANVQCHSGTTYLSHLYYSIRWPDGALVNYDTGQFAGDASAVCV